MPTTDFVASRVRVRGSGGATYLVTTVGLQALACTCPDFVHRSGPRGESCKHMQARVGQSSVGVTRCALCVQLLSIEEIELQPRGSGASSSFEQPVDDGFPRFCSSCVAL